MKQTEGSQLSPELEKIRQRVGDKEFAQVLEHAQKQMDAQTTHSVGNIKKTESEPVLSVEAGSMVGSQEQSVPVSEKTTESDKARNLAALINELVVKGEGRLMDKNGNDEGASDAVNMLFDLDKKE